LCNPALRGRCVGIDEAFFGDILLVSQSVKRFIVAARAQNYVVLVEVSTIELTWTEHA
jgi:hypothetical protein